MVLVAVALLALIATAALILLAGSVEWQKNQLQELADSTALDAALAIGVGCDAAKANAVIAEADDFLASRRTRTGGLTITPGTCAAPYKGQDTFAGGLTTTINYPYRAHQQQVEVILTLALPISFGREVGSTPTTNVVRRAVAEALPASMPAVSATTLTCASGQVNIGGSVVTQNLIVRSGSCALYAHMRFDAAAGTYSDLGNVSVYSDGQSWTAPGTCVSGSNTGSTKAICADGYELTGHVGPSCAVLSTSFLSAGDKLINPNPCAAGTGLQPVQLPPSNMSPEPNLDAKAVATLVGTGGAACVAAAVYPNIKIGATTIGTGLGPSPVKDLSGYYHFRPSCYGYLSITLVTGGLAVLDPGFYYFNGSGFAGGGGICLGGKTLLARDVTIEFVNTAGFSSNTCAANGGGNCANPCLFGSDPANTPADAPSNLTWFAAPCTGAPNPPDNSCPGSAWCTQGDRSCTNQLLWASPTGTGQINLTGANGDLWLLGTISWPGPCAIQVNRTNTIAGALACDTLSLTAAAGVGIAVGSDYGINTALAEAILIE
jgi:hypothetical protein